MAERGGFEPPQNANKHSSKSIPDSLVDSLPPEINEIVSAWGKLPAHVRTAIVTLVRGVIHEDR
jgi:hypothetical protein